MKRQGKLWQGIWQNYPYMSCTVFHRLPCRVPSPRREYHFLTRVPYGYLCHFKWLMYIFKHWFRSFLGLKDKVQRPDMSIYWTCMSTGFSFCPPCNSVIQLHSFPIFSLIHMLCQLESLSNDKIIFWVLASRDVKESWFFRTLLPCERVHFPDPDTDGSCSHLSFGTVIEQVKNWSRSSSPEDLAVDH